MLGWAALPCTGPSGASCSATWRRPQRRAAAGSKAKAVRQGASAAGRDRPFQATRRVGALDAQLLAGELVRLTEHASISRETVRRRLAENI